jgi:Domain of unknown function (DUF5615)
MRVLLDAHFSRRRLGALLARRGHDVVALSEDAKYAGLADDQVLALATAEERVLVTRNSRDFAPILRDWAEGGRSHGGCVLIWTLRPDEHATIARRLERLFRDRPTQRAWRDLTIAI